MLLHIDGSMHQWFGDERWYDLIVILDDATSEIYYAQLVEEEATRTVMEGLRTVIENKGLFCALYSDRGSHFFVTPKAGEKVDKHRLTQVGRAMKELGVQMIPAYSPQELRLAGIATLEGANTFLRERYIAEFNQKFTVAAAEKGTAFRRTSRADLDWIFSVQTERVVAQDNTIRDCGSPLADRKEQVPQFASRLHRDDPRAPGRPCFDPVWPACGRSLHGHRRTSPTQRKRQIGERWKRRAPFETFEKQNPKTPFRKPTMTAPRIRSWPRLHCRHSTGGTASARAN